MPTTELEARLRPIARDRIVRQVLPRAVPNQIWGGRGSGKHCSLCDLPIAADQVEYEIEHPDAERGRRSWRFHIVCQSIWQLECARQQLLQANRDD